MMLLPVRDTMDRFLMAASKLDSSWPAGDCEVVREAVMQWLPLECCQGKIKALEIMQKVLDHDPIYFGSSSFGRASMPLNCVEAGAPEI